MGQRHSQDVPSPEIAGDERRTGRRRDARALGPVVARLIGGSEVRLIDFSQRGVLLESDTRLLIGARATIKITTTDAVVTVGGYVVRSRVSGVKDGALVYHTAMALNDDLTQLEQAAKRREETRKPAPVSDLPHAMPLGLSQALSHAPPHALSHAAGDAEHGDTEAHASASAASPAMRGSESASGGECIIGPHLGHDTSAGAVLEFLATVPHDLAELRRRAAVNNWTASALDR